MARIKGFGDLGKIFGQDDKSAKITSPQDKPLPPPPKNFATAPYNFVSLPEKILPAEEFEPEKFREHILKNGKLSGEILLTIEALTPLFIGSKAFVDRQNSKSFSPVGTPIIPGSSLRGMFKNIFKIVTCGAFRGQTTSQRKGEDFNDEHIYFRCLMASKKSPAWMAELHDRYEKRMVRNIVDKNGKPKTVKKAQPGFLIRRSKDGKYFIAPSMYTSDRAEDFKMIKDFQQQYGAVALKDSRIHWVGGVAYILTGNQWANQPEQLLTEEEYKAFKEHLKVLRDELDAGKISKETYDEEARKHGKQIIRYTKLKYIELDRDKWFEVPEEVRTSYEHDRNRGGVDLFKKEFGILERDELERRSGQDFPDVDTLIPCHFLTDGEQVTAFGHGQCFRIPYIKRIGDAVPEKLRDEKIVDFADALFGRQVDKKISWASRVYFEDAKPVAGTISTLPKAKAHPLMQPNPTSYQLYLKQGDGVLKDWDSDRARIRGYKLYWHKSADDWHANDFELKENQKRVSKKQEPLTKDMTPLATGSKFTAKIRFKNLSEVELGALMMVFDLDGLTNAAYKIGQGKPFGFGSVKIQPTLYVEDDDTYTQLFDGDGWRNPCSEKNPAEYLDKFKKYLKACDMLKTWQKVMDELKKILDCSLIKRRGRSDWVNQMRGKVKKSKRGEDMFELDERFKNRLPLPTIKTIFEAVK